MSDTLLTKTIASTATLKIANIHSLDLFYTPIEERFERITRLARRALHAPVAAISLLNEDKQWFKSAAGWGISELPRDQAICKLTVEANQILMIGDTLAGPARRQTSGRCIGAALSRLRRPSVGRRARQLHRHVLRLRPEAAGVRARRIGKRWPTSPRSHNASCCRIS